MVAGDVGVEALGLGHLAYCQASNMFVGEEIDISPSWVAERSRNGINQVRKLGWVQ